MSEGPFDYIKSINDGIEIELDKNYNKFLTGRAFSYHLDTVVMANEINRFPDIDDRLHYDFFRSVIRPGKRYSKWHKPVGHAGASALSLAFDIPMHQAYLLLPLYNEQELKEISELVHTKETK